MDARLGACRPEKPPSGCTFGMRLRDAAFATPSSGGFLSRLRAAPSPTIAQRSPPRNCAGRRPRACPGCSGQRASPRKQLETPRISGPAAPPSFPILERRSFFPRDRRRPQSRSSAPSLPPARGRAPSGTPLGKGACTRRPRRRTGKVILEAEAAIQYIRARVRRRPEADASRSTKPLSGGSLP